MMDDKMISRKDANALIRKEMRIMMKHAGFPKAAHRSGLFFREQAGFLQAITLDFYHAFPEINAHIFPTFLYANGNSPYVEADMIQIRFDEMGKDVPVSFSRLILFTPEPSYRIGQFEKVWENNKRLVQEYLIPCLDSMDFEKTLSLFSSKRMQYFQVRMGAEEYVECAYAVGLLKCGAYEEAEEQLKKSRDFYAQKVEKIGENGTDIFLFKNNLAYIDDLLYQLQNQPDGWKENIAARIDQTTSETLQMWSSK